MKSDASAGVGHLIMIFEEADKGGTRTPTRVRAAPLLLPRIPLTLVQEIPLRHRRELIGRPVVVGAVRGVLAGQRDKGGVVPVLVPDAVETAWSTLTDVLQKRDILRLVFGDDEHTTRMCDRTGMSRQFLDDVLRRAIGDRVDSVE